MRKYSLGFFINPYAGVGGPAAEKGSDAAALQERAIAGELPLRAAERASVFLDQLDLFKENVDIYTVPGPMGQDLLESKGISAQVLPCELSRPSSAADSVEAAKHLVAQSVDVLVFIGGDGTARDVCNAIGESQLVLGVPRGVKMHSAVFAVTSLAAAAIVNLMLSGQQLAVHLQEVRDIDEDAFRQGKVVSRLYGHMTVPALPEYVQHVKQGGREVEELVLADIAAEIQERLSDLEPVSLVIFGPGSTTHFIQEEFGSTGTLLGVDTMLETAHFEYDLNAQQLLHKLKAHLQENERNSVKLVVTLIGGQGHVIGRGNQQLSPELLRLIGRDNLWLVSTVSKLNELDGRPLLIDSNDPELDKEWSGLIPVITGYRDERLYPLGLKTHREA